MLLHMKAVKIFTFTEENVLRTDSRQIHWETGKLWKYQLITKLQGRMDNGWVPIHTASTSLMRQAVLCEVLVLDCQVTHMVLYTVYKRQEPG